jgi:putative phage-type endonuclease
MQNDLQQTPEWHALRIGKLTASRMIDAMDRTAKGASAAKREALIFEKAVERITGLPQSKDMSRVPAVAWGNEMEQHAKVAVTMELGILGKNASLIDHPEIDMFSASPDWIVDGQPWEFKCPETKTHFLYLLDAGVPKQYQPQLAAQCLCMGVEQGFFVSYDPRAPLKYQLIVRPFNPGKEYLDAVESAAKTTLQDIQAVFERLLSGSTFDQNLKRV